MFFLIQYARVIHAIRRFLSRTGLLSKLDEKARHSRWGLWFRSLFSVLDFHDFIQFDTPWWTLASGRRVRDFLESTPKPRALEWGSGASTVWLASLCDEVISIESDAHWADMVRGSVGPHVTILTPEIPLRTRHDQVASRRWGFRQYDFTHYVDAIDKTPGVFDLIVIDGRVREACFDKALGRLAPGGMILFDNTNRLRYRRALRAHAGQISVSTDVGLTPILPWPSETSIIRQVDPAVYAASDSAGAHTVTSSP